MQARNVKKLLFEDLQGAIYPGSDIWGECYVT